MLKTRLNENCSRLNSSSRLDSESIMVSTTPVQGKVPKVRDGKSILAAGKQARSIMHVLEGFYCRYLGPDAQPPSGKTDEDILELCRRCAYVSRKSPKKISSSEAAAPASEEQDQDAEEAYDLHVSYSAVELDEMTVPDSFSPPGWLAFVFYGPYGKKIYHTDPLPILAADPEEQETLRVPRSVRKSNAAEEKHSTSQNQRPNMVAQGIANQFLEEYKANNSRLQLHQTIMDLKDTLKILKADLEMTVDDDEKHQLQEQIKMVRNRVVEQSEMLSRTAKLDEPPSILASLSMPDKDIMAISEAPYQYQPSQEDADSWEGAPSERTRTPSPTPEQPVQSTKKRIRRTKAELENRMTKEQVITARKTLAPSQAENMENENENHNKGRGIRG